MTTTRRMLTVMVSVVLMPTLAWAQEKPRLGFKDIYLGMPEEALRLMREESCREEIDRGNSRWKFEAVKVKEEQVVTNESAEIVEKQKALSAKQTEIEQMEAELQKQAPFLSEREKQIRQGLIQFKLHDVAVLSTKLDAMRAEASLARGREEEWEYQHRRERSKEEQLTLCLAEPIVSLPRRYQRVGDIPVNQPAITFRDGKIEAIDLVFGYAYYEIMKDALIEKYGSPTNRTVDVVKNRLGATFNSEVLSWKRDDGGILMIERSGNLDLSTVMIYSQAYEKALEKEKRSRAKKGAEGL